MVSELFSYAFGLLAAVTLVAAGSYIGTLRALETFYSESDSLFLSDDAGPREP